MNAPTKKTEITPQEYQYWLYEIACLRDCYKRPCTVEELKDHIDEIRGYIWYAVGEDLWMQP
jgi:hypothetical protein